MQRDFKQPLLSAIATASLMLLASCGSGSTLTASPATPTAPATTTAPATPPTQSTALNQSASAPATTQLTAQPAASTGTSSDSSRRVSLENGRVSFVLPPGFTPMTADEIALKFPRRGGNQPQYAYANDRRSVAIAITFSSSAVSPQQLPELKDVLQRSIQQAIPNTQWLNQEIIQINSTSWAHLEFVSPAIDTNIHNDTYFTSFDGKMLGFNFNATVEQYGAFESALRQTRDSISIQQ